jgi:very-short-patch-repair endonuclease
VQDELRDWLARPMGVANGDKKTLCESPIENVFLRAFSLLSSTRALNHGRIGILTDAQVYIGRRRVDFLFTRDDVRLVVECDGHDFHERTKEQAESDKSRDRELSAKGYIVMRFTGSEIWRNPFKAATEVLDFLVSCQSKAA